MATLEELYNRRALCQHFIDLLTGVDDPRRDSAIEEYRRQLTAIEAKIIELTGRPPDIVVGLKSAQLFGQAPK